MSCGVLGANATIHVVCRDLSPSSTSLLFVISVFCLLISPSTCSAEEVCVTFVWGSFIFLCHEETISCETLRHLFGLIHTESYYWYVPRPQTYRRICQQSADGRAMSEPRFQTGSVFSLSQMRTETRAQKKNQTGRLGNVSFPYHPEAHCSLNEKKQSVQISRVANKGLNHFCMFE